jgi:eukaryotic-like serine/threonine-protein kinase
MGQVSSTTSSPYRVVGRYRVYSELASGGMATVHLGCLLGPAGFSKLVAIKCLHQQFALEPEFVSMFLDEARLASSIHHPNVVASLDVVAEQGELLVVMEYVHGETLAGLLRLSRQKADKPPTPVIIRVLCEALEGLHAAHTASLAGNPLNIVHRDVSPQNIMVGADGNTRVLDFGIAQAALRSHVTSAGTIKGKIAYMSPEQVQSRPVDARTDVFAAGVVLWEALTGRRLFFAPDSRDVVELLLTLPIPPPSSVAPHLSKELDAVVLKALARDVDERFASAHEFAEALRRVAGEGSRREVAEWVGRVAREGLDHRLELLQALEASAIHTQVAVALPVVTGSSSQAASVPEGTHTQALTTSTSILPHPPASPARRRAPLLVAVAGVSCALLVWLLTRPTETPRPPERVVAAAPSVAPALSLALAPPAPESEPSLPVVAAESMPILSAAPSAPPKVPKKFAAPSVVTTGPVRARACNPPYRIDEAGVRRVKPECL